MKSFYKGLITGIKVLVILGLIGSQGYLYYDKFFSKKTIVESVNNNAALQIATNSCDSTTTLEKIKKGTYRILRSDGGHGTGFAFTSDGYIVTNNHVVEGAKSLNAWVDGAKPAKVIKSFPNSDIAVIKVDFPTEAIPWEDNKNIKIAEPVWAIGWPLSSEEDSSISYGVYSRRFWAGNTELLQVDLAVNPGNSGGPLINKCGVVGMITAKEVWTFEESAVPVEGMGYAISSFSLMKHIQEYAPKDDLYKFEYLRPDRKVELSPTFKAQLEQEKNKNKD